MARQATDHTLLPAYGDRVRVCDGTLQAFYGTSGTVVKICRCRRDGHITRVDVWMDDLSASEAYASFYPHELSVLPQADSSSVGEQ
jgi:hypothetical protein